VKTSRLVLPCLLERKKKDAASDILTPSLEWNTFRK
jgi:hypothetical protein